METVGEVNSMEAEVVCRPKASAEARDEARAFMDSLHLAVSAHAAQNVLLVVAELVANALRHAGAVLEVRFSSVPHGLMIAVDDPSAQFPQGRAPDWSGQGGGFGWLMVQRMACSVQVRLRAGGGKTVEAVVAR